MTTTISIIALLLMAVPETNGIAIGTFLAAAPLSLSILLSIVEQNKRGHESSGIVQYNNGLNSVPDHEWNFSLPIQILHTQVPSNGLNPGGHLLKRFRDVKIVFAHSPNVANARMQALGLSDYHESGIDRTKAFLREINHKFSNTELDKVEIVCANRHEFPFGITLINGDNIFYCPLWNYVPDGSLCVVDGVCFRLSRKLTTRGSGRVSHLGDLIVKSFERLYSGGQKIARTNDKKFDIVHFETMLKT